MQIKLDLKDKKLLSVLTQNARTPANKIARAVGLSKSSVFYRMERLKNLGVIQRFMPVLNYKLLGLHTYDLLIRLKATETQEKKIIKYLSNHPNVLWGVELFGKWDLFLQLVAPSIDDVKREISNILLQMGKAVETYEVKLLVERFKITHQKFKVETKFKFARPKIDWSSAPKLDNLDKKILDYLNAVDGMASYHEVGKGVGASIETARNRMLSLFNKGIILYYMPLLSHEKLGLKHSMVFVSFRHLSKKAEENIRNYVNSRFEIKIAFRSLGKLEMFFYVVYKEDKEFRMLVKEMKRSFSDSLMSVDFAEVTNEFQLNFFPKALEKL